MITLKAPKGASSLHLDRVAYPVDSTGHVTVPDEFVAGLYQYGYTAAQPATAPVAKASKEVEKD